MGARYQDPVVGRFAQRDPIGPGYSYASNNPISLSDPSGAAATSIGSPWSNFMNWLGSPQGQITLVAVDVGLLALSVPTAGTTDAILAGLLVGAIFVAATYVISGGTATAGDYFGVFLLGFTIGVAIADVYSAFGAEAGELGAGKPSLTRRALADGGSIEGAAGAEGSMTAERAAGIAPRLTANGERLADFPEGTSEFFQRAEATEYRVSTGYKNMDAFEREFGPAGPKMHWHHI